MAFQGDSIYWVEVGKIVANPFQPRKEFNEDKLKELAESIRMYGVLQPLTVTRNEIQGDGGAFYTEYELIAGERRWRASKLAGLEQVPVIIRSGEDTEQEKLELAIIENLQREDLNAVDRALAFKQLADVFKLSHAQVAKKVGRSRMYVSNSIRLLALPDCILNSVALGDISEGHARTLLMLKERPEEQDVVYREILLKKLSVREVERIARKIATDKVRKKKWVGTDAHLIEIEREFTNTLGTRVQIAKTDFGGKVTIDYFSDDDLQKLLTMVQSQEKSAQVKTDDTDGDSGTVIEEMSPEAAVLVKIAAATPLEIVESAEVSGEELNTEEVSMSLNTDEVSSVEELPEHLPQEVEVVVPADTGESSDVVARSEAVQDVATDMVSASPQMPVPDVVTPQQAEPIDLNSEEFAFVSQHSAEARKEDLVVPTELEKTMFRHEPAVSQALDSLEDTPSQSEIMAEAAAEALSEAAVNIEVPHQEPQSDTEDDDLYSMKHFSL